MCEPFKPENIPNTDQLSRTLADQIGLHLSRQCWTMRELSIRSGVPYETLKKIMNARIQNPSFRSIYLISAALGCSLDELAGREGYPSLFTAASNDKRLRRKNVIWE